MSTKIMQTAALVLLSIAVTATFTPRYAIGQHEPPPHQTECFDFVTGGGWFAPRNEGNPTWNAPERVNFGFNAGARSPNNQDLKGHFNLVDHNDGRHIQGLNVLDYDVCPAGLNGDANCRLFSGDAKVDGATGFSYFVYVCDYGEPGRDDRIRVEVYGPGFYYEADNRSPTKTCPTGAANCGDLDGGNLQLHKPCPNCP